MTLIINKAPPKIWVRNSSWNLSVCILDLHDLIWPSISSWYQVDWSAKVEELKKASPRCYGKFFSMSVLTHITPIFLTGWRQEIFRFRAFSHCRTRKGHAWWMQRTLSHGSETGGTYILLPRSSLLISGHKALKFENTISFSDWWWTGD
jgi:hypothetical protein